MRIWNRETIKYIAMFTMLLNHIANIFLEPGTLLWELMVDIGFFTGPVMCWFLVEGYHHTRSKKRYAGRLFLFAVLSEFPFCFAFSYGNRLRFLGGNMLFTLWICFLILLVLEKVKNPCWKVLLCILLTGATQWCDWPFVAAIGTILFAYTYPSKKGTAVSFVAMAALAAAYQYEIYSGFWFWTPKVVVHAFGAFAGVLSAGIAVVFLYNGTCMKRGRSFSKWFFYLFYPVHLLLLGTIRVLSIV